MTISFQCPDCQKSFRVRNELAGKRVSCKSCGKAIRIPSQKEVSSDDEFLSSLDEAVTLEANSSRQIKETGSTQQTSSAKKSRSRKKEAKPRTHTRRNPRLIVVASILGTVALLTLLIAAMGVHFLVGSWKGAHVRDWDAAYANLERAYDSDDLESLDRAVDEAYSSDAFEQAPGLATVISWHFSNRIWLPCLFIGLELVVMGLGVWMWILERDPYFRRDPYTPDPAPFSPPD